THVLPGCHLAEPQGAIVAARREPAAVWREGDGLDGGGVPLVALQLPTTLEAPQPDAPVAPGGEGTLAVGGERHVPYRVGVPLEGAGLPAWGPVPEPHDPVHSGRQGALAVRGEGDGVDLALVPDQPAHLLPGLPVPQAERPVAVLAAGREHQGPIRR